MEGGRVGTFRRTLGNEGAVMPQVAIVNRQH